MQLLITGGAGFIGSNFIRYWLNKYPQHTITNLDALTYAGNLSSLEDLSTHPNYTFIHGDIRDPQVVDQACRNIDTIIHFAAESHVDRSLLNPQDFITTNVTGTLTLLQAALKHNITHFHYIGTDEVFGSLPLNTADKFSETTKFDPRSPYAASKAGAEHLVNSFHHSFGLPITITNCSNNFGPYHHPEKMIPLFITNLLEGKKVPVYGDGLNIRDWLYVEDHCTAIDTVIHHGRVGESYLVGAQHEHEINNLELTYKLLKLLDKDESSIEYVSDRPGHDRRYAVNWSKLASLGWKPAHDFDTRLAHTVQWYREHPDWWQPIKAGQFKTFEQQNYTDRK